MSTFETEFASDAVVDLLTQFGATITYTPNGGDARSILAVINRGQAQAIDGPGEAIPGPGLTVEVANRATAIADDTVGGISSSALDEGLDTVTIPKRHGGTAKARHFKVMEHDAAMLTLEVF